MRMVTKGVIAEEMSGQAVDDDAHGPVSTRRARRSVPPLPVALATSTARLSRYSYWRQDFQELLER